MQNPLTAPDTEIFSHLRDDCMLSLPVLSRVENWLYTQAEVRKILQVSPTDNVENELVGLAVDNARREACLNSLRLIAQNHKLDPAERIAEILHRISAYDNP